MIVSQSDNACRKVYDWDTADFNGMTEYLVSVDWYSLLTTNLTPDSLWQTFCEHLQFAVDLYALNSAVLKRRKLRKKVNCLTDPGILGTLDVPS